MKVETATPAAPLVGEPVPAIAAPTGRDHVAAFLRSTIAPSAAGEISLRQLQGRYLAWCVAEEVTPLRAAELGRELRDVIDALGLACQPGADDVSCVEQP